MKTKKEQEEAIELETKVEKTIAPKKKDTNSKTKSPKKTKPKKEKEIDNTKYTLVELVLSYENSPYALTKISEKGYYPQYIKELNKQDNGLSIKPTITKSEFNKILE